MILHDFERAPNPRRVRIFIAEKNIDIEIKKIDLMKRENVQTDYLKINPSGALPFLQLDDKNGISESIAICRYLEEKYPDPRLMGSSPLEKAQIEMWQRIIEFHGISAAGEAFRNKVEGFKDRAIAGPNPIKQIPDLIERSKILLDHFFKRIDSQLSQNDYIAGGGFSIADISAYIAIDFAGWSKIVPEEKFTSLNKWFEKMKLRNSINA